jgi:hypothetical protein
MRFTSLMDKLPVFIFTLSLTITLGCGNEGDTINVVAEETGGGQQEEQGSFQTPNMIVINNQVVTNVKAISRVEIEGDEIVTRVQVRNAPRNVIHKQYIYSGRRCPNMADDTNGDGYLDWKEVQEAVGPILIPLDENLLPQDEGGYPRSNARGNYNYVKRASLSRILADLRAPVDDSNDGFGRLRPDQELNLEGRVVIIHGIEQSVNLPYSVASSPNDPAHLSLPICCGVIEETNEQDDSNGGTTGGTTDETTGQVSDGQI